MIDFPFEAPLRFTAQDDERHQPGPSPDWTETIWFSFFVPERGLGGWLYVQMRPNLGTTAGGAFVYGPGSWEMREIPYYAYFQHQPLPSPLDIRDVAFRTGVSVKVLEPGQRYQLGYRFRDQTDFLADLEFQGLTPPVPHVQGAPPFVGSSHFDQHGHVTGTIMLHGEMIPVDCYAVRDRSWGRRPELVGLGAKRLSYVFGTTSADEAFLVFCLPEGGDQTAEVETLSSGYLLRDGKLRRLATATRHNRRDPATGGVAHVDVEATDTDGRALHVSGEKVSAMALQDCKLCINTFLRFSVDGRDGWGEDQDVWPLARFAQMRRSS